MQQVANKKNLGQYFTKTKLWDKLQIRQFIEDINPKVIVDPFAGQGHLIEAIKGIGFADVVGYDIDSSLCYMVNDSLINIPKITDGLILTNPPYLAKNSAKKLNLSSYVYFNDNIYQDLYQIAIASILKACKYAICIIPETFLLSNFFVEHIHSLSIIEDKLFDDTDCPVCICCFIRKDSDIINEYDIYKGSEFLFNFNELNERKKRFDSILNYNMKFNAIGGNLGLRGIDGTSVNDRIRFCLPKDLNYDVSTIKISSRAITTIQVNFDINEKFIKKINTCLEDYRNRTKDVLLSPFKNNNKAGMRRRRIDFAQARQFINKTIETY